MQRGDILSSSWQTDLALSFIGCFYFLLVNICVNRILCEISRKASLGIRTRKKRLISLDRQIIQQTPAFWKRTLPPGGIKKKEMNEVSYSGTRIAIVHGDITDQNTDAIVNAANSSLMGGGGVDGAVHRKGGDAILAECRRIRETQFPNGLPTGQAVITSGGRLKARHVIHTVGPVWDGTGKSELLLRDCYFNSLSLAKSLGLGSIAFPAISTGAFGYPIRPAARVALETTKQFVKSSQKIPGLVVFVLFTGSDYDVYEAMVRSIFQNIS
jgi:O-acetyl-ADP-ribose deacetylase (regulator of RNase III)